MRLTESSPQSNPGEKNSLINPAIDQKIIALAGNPNVGKSTVFNALTGLKQHTGNWSGKTVSNAAGSYTYLDKTYTLIDVPGCYSLMAHSREEEVARDYICFGQTDAVAVVCDATCLMRNLNLALQIIEAHPRTVVCVNLLDEANKKHIRIDLEKLSAELGVPVIGTAARNGSGLTAVQQAIAEITAKPSPQPPPTTYAPPIEKAIATLLPLLENRLDNAPPRWLALRLLDNDQSLRSSLGECLGYNIFAEPQIAELLAQVFRELQQSGMNHQKVKDAIVGSLLDRAALLSKKVIIYDDPACNRRDRRIDRVLTGKWSGLPIMFLTLMAILWITIEGANYPSQLINALLTLLENKLLLLMQAIGAPPILTDMLIMGIYRTLAWVISVMLPPMAIFFPLFTLLEDLGYLPRIAFNLDKCFQKCAACGKQALTMCMGFGCNAAAIIGCRIIDSPRERLIAIITNNFVPCNGRFPTMIAIISMFLIGTATSAGRSLLPALVLSAIIILGIGMTLLISKLLSITLLKGLPSSFTLELPPYRRPQIGQILLRSLLDRTLFVLGRAVMIAAPAGLVIWLMANLTVNDISLLSHCSGFLDPFARLLGLDGIILLAFILGLPANEIVVPIIIMSYMAQGHLLEISDLTALRQLLLDNGWTWLTALCTILFSLMHWPCSTTCLTIKKETQSHKWTWISIIVPTVCGMTVCALVAAVVRATNLL